MILVVGATGQLGSRIVGELGRQGRAVQAMVRPPDVGRDLAEASAELVTADLLRPETLDHALRGVRAVIATANVVAPTHREDSQAALARGYADPIERSRAAGVERFVYASVPDTPLGRRRPDDPGQARGGGAARRLGHVLGGGPDAFTEVAPSASNVMGLNRLLAASEAPWDTTEVARRLGVSPLRTVEQVLRAKAALPAD